MKQSVFRPLAALLAAVALSFALPARSALAAPGEPAGPLLPVDPQAQPASLAFAPRVARNAQGDSAVVWLSQRADVVQVLLRRFDAADQPLDAAPIEVAVVVRPDDAAPAVSLDAARGVSVAWLDGERFRSPNLMLRSYAADGSALGPARLIDAGTDDHSPGPPELVTAAGEHLLAWQSFDVPVRPRQISLPLIDLGSSGGQGRVRVLLQRLSPVGALQGSPTVVDDSRNWAFDRYGGVLLLSASGLSAARTNLPGLGLGVRGGRVVVAWRQFRGWALGVGVLAVGGVVTRTVERVFSSAFDLDSGLVSGPVELQQQTRRETVYPSPGASPRVAVAANGDYVVGWNAAVGETGNVVDLFARRVSAGVAGSTLTIASGQGLGSENFALSGDAAGRFVVAWCYSCDWPVVGSGVTDLQLRRYGANGEPLAASQPLPLEPGASYGRLDLASSPDGDFSLVYARAVDEDGNGPLRGARRVLLQRYAGP